jgi:ubiquinol-cytochrome c reductase cytochrome c1 subunit
MAKDVTTFLAWAAEPEHDDRKKMGVKAIIILSVMTILSLWIKRNRWTTIKSRKIVYVLCISLFFFIANLHYDFL